MGEAVSKKLKLAANPLSFSPVLGETRERYTKTSAYTFNVRNTRGAVGRDTSRAGSSFEITVRFELIGENNNNLKETDSNVFGTDFPCD